MTPRSLALVLGIVYLHLATAGAAGFVAWRPRTGERRSLLGDRRRSNAPQSR